MDGLDAMDAMEERSTEAKREAAERADERELGLFACPRCGARIGDSERIACDQCNNKSGCVHCMVLDADGGHYCDVACQIACYRELIEEAKRYAEEANAYYSQRIAQLEAQG